MYVSPEQVAAITADRIRDADRRRASRLALIVRDCCHAAGVSLRTRLARAIHPVTNPCEAAS